MADFTLDTSGAVVSPTGQTFGAHMALEWADLDAFTQGYVEAELRAVFIWAAKPDGAPYGFADLAPETLALILKDCEALAAMRAVTFDPDVEAQRNAGAVAWMDRQAGDYDALPPLVATLGDDDKVYLRDCA